MKKLLLIYFFLMGTIGLSAQENNDPVKFTYSVKKLDGKNYELHILATLDDGWHLYSQTQPKEAIAKPTEIKILKSPLVTLVAGKAKEIGTKETYQNKEVGIKQYQYGHKVEFVQGFSMKATIKTYLAGTVTYQVCTDERCLAVKTVSFNLPIQ